MEQRRPHTSQCFLTWSAKHANMVVVGVSRRASTCEPTTPTQATSFEATSFTAVLANCTGRQLKHWPVARLAQGRSSKGPTPRSYQVAGGDEATRATEEALMGDWSGTYAFDALLVFVSLAPK